MSVRMKALRSFRGEPGEGNINGDDRMVDAGGEFPVASESRAAELERIGHAVPVADVQAAPPLQSATMPPAENKAAHAGPLASPGGETGAENAPSSSDRDRPQRPSRSKKRPGGLEF